MAGRQTTIVFIWDFDKTLIPNYSEAPLFQHFRVKEEDFWDEVNHLAGAYKTQGLINVSKDTTYLNHILTYVEKGIFKNLTNQLLYQLGAKIHFYKGLPDFLNILKKHIATNPLYQKYDISLEHYIVSTGLYEMIKGSKIGPLVDGIWANEFLEEPPLPGFLRGKIKAKQKEQKVIRQIGYTLDNTTKTRAIYEINKGVNKIPGIDVNTTIPYEQRRVPIKNMVYIADGPSDIPSFSAINQNGGTSYGVYKPGVRREFEQAYELFSQKRVKFFSEADYSEGSQTYLAILHLANSIAQRIVQDKQHEQTPLMSDFKPLPKHFSGEE